MGVGTPPIVNSFPQCFFSRRPVRRSLAKSDHTDLRRIDQQETAAICTKAFHAKAVSQTQIIQIIVIESLRKSARSAGNNPRDHLLRGCSDFDSRFMQFSSDRYW